MPAIALAAAWITAGARLRRGSGFALGLLVLAPPWLAAPPILRGIFCLLGALAVMRLVDLVREPHELPVRARLWHVVSPADSRTLRPGPRTLDARGLGVALLWAATSLAALWLAARPGQGLAVRWAEGLVTVYGFVEALWGSVGVAYRLLGFEPPLLHANPVASRSIAKLWGARWSLPVSRWVDRNALRPLARRGWPQAGVAAAFLCSAIIHAYAALAGAGLAMAGLMLGYFLLQGVLVLLERPLGVARWPRAAAHAWVLGVMVATSPLFVEPFLRAVGIA